MSIPRFYCEKGIGFYSMLPLLLLGYALTRIVFLQVRRYKASPKLMEKAEQVYNRFKILFCNVDNDGALLANATAEEKLTEEQAVEKKG